MEEAYELVGNVSISNVNVDDYTIGQSFGDGYIVELNNSMRIKYLKQEGKKH
jgi:hypothetical protein